MGHDAVASWTIKVLGDDVDVSQVLAGLKGKFQSAVNDLERISNQADLFKTLQDRIAGIQKAMDANAVSAQNLRFEIDKINASGGKVGDDLTKALAATEKQTVSLTTQLGQATTQLGKVSTTLKTAGFDTDKYTASQAKLALATTEASDALALQSAKSALGLVTLADTVPKIEALNAAFQTFKASGATVAEVTQAELSLEKQTAAVLGGVTQLPGAFEKMGAASASAFTLLGGPALIAIAGIATLAEGIKTVVTASNDFANGLGKIGSVTTLTDEQLRGLGESARSLAKDIGIDVNDALKQLYEIIRSTNLPADDALTVLDASARAAKVTFTDLNVVTKVSADLISAFGLSAGQLSVVLDGIYASSKTGGPSFADLSGKIGSLSVVARSAGVSVGDMTALLNVMSSASGDGAGSVSELQKILIKFDTEKVRSELRAMGITTTDVTEIIKELTARGNVNLATLLDLGVASSKSAVGITALTRDSTALTEALARQAEALGQVAVALKKVDELPKDAFEKLAASLKDLAITSGVSDFFTAFVAGFTKANTELAANIRLLKERAAAMNDTSLGFQDYISATDQASAGDVRLSGAIAQTSVELDKFHRLEALGFGAFMAEQAVDTAKKLEVLQADILKTRDALGGIATELAANVALLNAAATEQIAQATKVADERIAALDRSTKAETATAAATVSIQTELAKTRLKIIVDNEAEVKSATDDAIKAREEALRKTEKSEEQIQGELAAMRIAAIKPTIAAYQSLYDNLITQEQGYATKLEALGKAKLSFQQGIEAQLLDLRIGAVDAAGKAIFSSYDQQVARANEADRLMSLSRAAALQGDTVNEEKFANEAIAQSKKVVGAIDADGKILIGQDQAQAFQAGILLQALENNGIAYKKQSEAAKEGLQSTTEAIVLVKGKLDEVLKVQADMQAKAKEGLQYTINLEQKSFDDVKEQLLQFVNKERQVRLKVVFVDASGAAINSLGDITFPGSGSVTVPAPGGAAGGYVGKDIRGFAAGGPVFRALASHKVPGTGSGDTVPALLPLGSFVMRKSASQYFGDVNMQKLIRGFADGGGVYNSNYDLSQPLFNKYSIKGGQAGLDYLQGLIDAQHELGKLKHDAETFIDSIIAEGGSTGAREVQYGESLVHYLRATIAAIYSSNDNATIAKLLGDIVANEWGYRGALEEGKFYNVPVARGGSATGLDVGPTKTSTAFEDLVANLQGPEAVAALAKKRGVPVKKALGGLIDSIPALLTPGEFILQPQAVANVSRMFGGGFLDALNTMRIPKGFLDTALTPPRRYATGGYVDGQVPARSMTGETAGASMTVIVNVQEFNDRVFNAEIVPRFNRLMKTSK